LASFALSSLPILLRLLAWRPGVVMVVAPALFSAPAGWMLARLCGASAWLHIQDFELDAAFELGLLRGALLRQVVTASERLLMRGFNVVSTISRQMVRKVAGKGVPLDRAELLPNWVDLRQIRPVDNAPALRTELGIDADECVCLFSGTINRKQGLDVLVQTARLLAHDPRIVIVICGNGELRPGLEAAAHGLSNIRFIDLRPAQELNTLLNMADMHLLPQLEGAADLVMPSKLTGMLASGRPVIAAAAEGTEIASVVEGLGMTIKPESAECFARAISELADDPKRRRELGAASRRYAEKALDADVLFDKLDQRLNMLGNTRHTPLVVNSRAGH
jgi:colanic acid biosynthesis glycosyl transferase WcaI